MTRYQVLTPLRRDGKVIAAGKTVELSDADAKALLRCKAVAIAEAGDEPSLDPPAAEPEDLAAVIGRLDKAAEGLWLKDGRPDTRALSDAAGRPVTAAERDAAWAAWQAQQKG
jgi:hypothetical protein